LIGLQKW